MKKVLVGFDGSEHSWRALERAVEYAGSDAELRILNIVDVPAQTGGHAPEPTDSGEVAEVEQELAEARAILKEKGVEADLAKGYGNPAEALVDEADRIGADLIVVGTRGIGPAKRWLMGSVSTKVVQHASCDVLVVR